MFVKLIIELKFELRLKLKLKMYGKKLINFRWFLRIKHFQITRNIAPFLCNS